MLLAPSVAALFKWRQFEPEMILLAVGWYVASLREEFESRLDEGLRIERDEVGLVAVNALVVGLVERAGFFWIEGQIAEALTRAHFSWARDQVIGLHDADRAPGTWRGRA